MDMRAFFPLLICCAVAPAADIPAPIAARMDQTALSFKSFSAELKQTDHTAIVNDDAQLTGIFRMRRVKPGDARVLIDYKGADARAISFEGDKVQIFYPKINTDRFIRWVTGAVLWTSSCCWALVPAWPI